MNRLIGSSAVVIAFSLLIGFDVQAGEWSATFGAGEVGKLALANDGGVLIVAAGANREQARPAAEALLAGLTAAGRFGVIMNDQALGDVSKLDDAQIVEKGKPFPVGAIAVVRVFGGAEGSEDRSVVVFYDKSGQVVTALNGIKGTPIAAGASEAQAGEGVSTATSTMVTDVVKKSSTDFEAAIAQYEERAIWFENWVGIDAQTGVAVARWTVPYMGKYKKSLKGSKFYDALGREDLVKRFKQRTGVKVGLMAGGGLLLAGGMGLLMYSILGDVDVDEEFDNKPPLISGIALGVVGAAAMTWGVFFKRHPVKEEEALRLVDEYNTKLRDELGLTEELLRSYKKLSTFTDLALTPLALPGGGGLFFSGRFNLSLD